MPEETNAQPEGLSNREKALVAEMTKQFAKVMKERDSELKQSVAPAIDVAGLGQALATAIREGNKDPIAEARKEKAKQRGKAEADDRERVRKLRESNCSHMFPFPYPNITRVAWAMQSDGIERGFCPACYALIHPAYKDSEGVFHEGHPDYEKLRRIPRHPLQSNQSPVGITY